MNEVLDQAADKIEVDVEALKAEAQRQIDEANKSQSDNSVSVVR